MEMPGVKEDAMPEAGKGGAGRTSPGGVGMTSVTGTRPGTLLHRPCPKAPGNYLVFIHAPLLSAGLDAGRREASANPEVPDLGCRRPGVVGRRDTQGGGGKFVLGKKIKWRKLESVRSEGGRVFAVPLRSVLR